MPVLIFWTIIYTIFVNIIKFLIRLPLWGWAIICVIYLITSVVGGPEKKSESSRLWDVAHAFRHEVDIKPDLVQAYAGAVDQEYTQVTVINNSDDVVNNVVMVCRRYDAYENPPENPHKYDDLNYERYKTNMLVMPHKTLSYRVWGHVLDSCNVEFKEYTPNNSDFKDFENSPGFTARLQ